MKTTHIHEADTTAPPSDGTVPNPSDSNSDILTIAEARKRLGPAAPSRDAFHKAIKRCKLKKLPAIADETDVRIRWGDILDYIAGGGFKNCGSKCEDLPRVAASPEFVEVDSSSTDSLITTCGASAATDTHADAQFIDVEVLDREPGNARPSELEEVGKLLADLPGFTNEAIIHKIRIFAGRAEKLAADAVAVGTRSLICAWACGTMFNKVKDGCKHGEFSPWLNNHLLTVGLSSRTCQRYMKLARKWQTLADLVESQPGLKDAYVACGIIHVQQDPPLGEDETSDKETNQASDDPTPAQRLMSSVNTLQKRLRVFTTSGKTLAPDDIGQLGRVIADLTRCYERL
jgi:hypothetical protein